VANTRQDYLDLEWPGIAAMHQSGTMRQCSMLLAAWCHMKSSLALAQWTFLVAHVTPAACAWHAGSRQPLVI
jgi:hypothetical protein